MNKIKGVLMSKEEFGNINNISERRMYISIYSTDDYTWAKFKVGHRYYIIDENDVEELEKIAEEHKNCTRKHWQSKCAEYSIKNRLLQNRIDKAIEYLEEKITDEDTGEELGYSDNINYKELLDILRGEDNE